MSLYRRIRDLREDADRIAVIKNGVCCEIGTFDELIAQKGEFYAMQTMQSL